MAFLSSKLVQDLQTAVANVQSSHSVQVGEQQLRQLRLRFDYELCLATFM